MTEYKTAIIDIGSNTVRLVIYHYEQLRGLKEIENVKAVARLRSFIDDTGILVEEGIERLEGILHSFNEILEDYNVEHVRAIATASIRQAQNGAAILARMKEVVGVDIELLSERQEAFYGYFAVVYTTSTPSGVTIDMGGGSTELTYFDEKELMQSISLPFGSVSLKQQFVAGEVLTADERQSVYDFAIAQFSTIPWLKDLNLPVIGIGGSARNMATFDQHRNNYPLSGVHQYRITRKDFLEIAETLTSMPLEQLQKLDGLSSDRADIIGPVIEVFHALMDVVGAQKFQFSRKGLREGLVIHRILKQNPHAFDRYDVFSTTAKFLCAEFGKDQGQIKHHEYLAEMLYKQLGDIGAVDFERQNLRLLLNAAKVYFLGEYIDKDAASQHTFYILSNRAIDGLNHKERVRLALMASYKNKDNFKRYAAPFEQWFSEDELKILFELGSILKFTYALDATKRNVVRKVRLFDKGEVVEMYIYTNSNSLAEQYRANRQTKHLERLIKKTIELHFIEEEG
ncbi:Ppx/GppA family phosphatase [Kurthia populi]|uniref:Ppx/GppA family phosphatase n=1 Tax=Kurthia populi TaxID=1562132 RepID=A0ABW5Y1W0_9BACL